MSHLFSYKSYLHFSVFAVLVLFSLKISAQSTLNDSIFSAADEIYRFKFQSADSVIKELEKKYPDDFLPHLLSANYYWWLIITGEDTTETREHYYEHLAQSLELLKTEKKQTIANDTLYYLITTYAYKARIYSMKYEYFSALAQLNNAIDYLKLSFGKEKDYEWFYLTSGLYCYYIEAVKKNYPFLLPYLIFLPDGSTKTGIDFLKQASSSENSMLGTEAIYFLMKIYLEEEKNYPEARKYSSRLIKKYPENLLYRYYQFKSYLKEENMEEAVRELNLMKHHAEKNNQLDEHQKNYFVNRAKEKLKKYYIENEFKK